MHLSRRSLTRHYSGRLNVEHWLNAHPRSFVVMRAPVAGTRLQGRLIPTEWWREGTGQWTGSALGWRLRSVEGCGAHAGSRAERHGAAGSNAGLGGRPPSFTASQAWSAIMCFPGAVQSLFRPGASKAPLLAQRGPSLFRRPLVCRASSHAVPWRLQRGSVRASRYAASPCFWAKASSASQSKHIKVGSRYGASGRRTAALTGSAAPSPACGNRQSSSRKSARCDHRPGPCRSDSVPPTLAR
jgi:hypothetical protein